MCTRLSIRSRMALVALAALSCAATLQAAANGSRADADALHRKFIQIATNGLAQKPAERSVTVLEREVNAYIAVHGRNELPEGVVDPVVTILPNGRLTGRAIVDLDAVRTSEERSVLSPWALLRGRVPVEVIGVLRTEKGVGAFTLESATVGGVPVPKTVLQELVGYYSRTEAQPEGIDIEAPFRLPARIREIRTGQGQALVVQ
jgi:hypothetical protein